MANVHRLGDYAPAPGAQMSGGLPFNYLPASDPHQENFWTMLKNSMCPKFTLVSFTTIVILLNTSLYIAMLSIYGPLNESHGISVGQQDFLYVKEKALRDMGGNNAQNVKQNGELYLLLSSIFLLPCFYYWVISTVMIMVAYSLIENVWGFKSAMAIYIGGGMCGALFGDVCNCCQGTAYSTSEVLSSTSAALGAGIGLVILYWVKLDVLGPMKGYMACMMGMMMFLVILMMFSGGQSLFTDNYGKMGGLLGGIFISMAVNEVTNPGEYETKVKQIGLGLLAFFVVLNIILLYSIQY